MAKTFLKQPAEVVDYFIDMREYFEEMKGDYIASADDVTVTIEPDTDLASGLAVLVNDGADGFKQWFSGGADKTKYKITFLVATNDGRTEEFEMYIKVKDT